MPFGISQIRNSANEVILDQNYFALEVIQEGNLTSAGALSNLVTLDFTGITIPLVFIRMQVGSRYFFGPTTLSRFWMSSNVAAGAAIPYKLCGLRADPAANPGGIGVRINLAGTESIAFHSRRKYLRIVDCFQTMALGGSSRILRSGDAADFGTAGDGSTNFWYIEHNTRPQPLSTYWLASLTGLASRPGSNNSTAWIIERKSTTRYEWRLDGDGVISRDNRIAMGLTDPTPTGFDVPRLVAL
jgi:hypothetical protein